MKEDIEDLVATSDPSYQQQASSRKIHQFGRSIHWIGVAILVYALIGILYQAWPLALLKPDWLLKISRALAGSSFYLLAGIMLLAAAPLVDPETEFLAKRARLAQRVASWLAFLYIFLIPVQIYAGVKLLQRATQEQQGVLSQSKQAVKRMEQATTWPEVRQAYSQIPGRKPPLPGTISQPLGVIKDRITDALNARVKTSETETELKRSQAWEQWLLRTAVNSLQMIMLFVGFAAIGRKSSSQPTLLQSLFNRNRSRARVPQY